MDYLDYNSCLKYSIIYGRNVNEDEYVIYVKLCHSRIYTLESLHHKDLSGNGCYTF